MSNGKKQHLGVFLIGIYLLLFGIWMIFATVYHGVRLFQMFTSEDFSIEYFRMVLYIYIGSFATDALCLVSGTMCTVAFIKPKSGKFIVRAGVISFVAYAIPCVTAFIYQGTLRTALYLILPILMIACGKYLAKYQGGQNPEDIPNTAFPFVHTLKLHIKQKQITDTENQ